MTLEALKEAKEIEEMLNKLNKRLENLYDPSKIDKSEFKEFRIKSATVEFVAQYVEQGSYRYPKFTIEIGSESATHLWRTHLNLIRGRIHHLKTKLSNL